MIDPKNPHIGSTFDSFLQEEGILDTVLRTAERRVRVTQAERAVHPGEVLADELREAGGSADRLAQEIDAPPHEVRQIITGQQPITPEMALRLAHRFKTSATFWLNLQAAYDQKRQGGAP